jgi:hypothetical protein
MLVLDIPRRGPSLLWRPRLANDKLKAREKGRDSELAEKIRAPPGVLKWLKNSLAFRATKKTEGFPASLKTSALAPVCLPPEQIEQRSSSGQAGFHTGSSSPPRTVGVVASVFSLASQWRVG